MEQKVKINTESGQNTFTTDLIKGFLECIILSAEQRTEIIIESELGYLIFHNKEFIGTEYIALRQRSRAPVWNITDLTEFKKFALNEALQITVIGQRDVDVDIIFRWSN